MPRAKRKIEFGDFQTPVGLAKRVCAFLVEQGERPASVLEPTCGTGAFLFAAVQCFPDARTVVGVDINPAYLAAAKQGIAALHPKPGIDLRLADFFEVDWPGTLASLPQPILVVGNPPWITASRTGAIAGTNVPVKSNFLRLKGLDAKTGKSNFDISEWMAIRLLESAGGLEVTFALLLKTSVARRVLGYAWTNSLPISSARLSRIDTPDSFGANADAGLLSFRTGRRGQKQQCQVAPWEDWRTTSSVFGTRSGGLVADVRAYDRTAHLVSGQQCTNGHRWRSGIKHDCARVMELRRTGNRLFNLEGEPVDVEPEWVFPLLKGSAVARGSRSGQVAPDRYMIVPQRRPGDDTSKLMTAAPRLWKYLTDHEAAFDRRRSSIHRGGQRFSVFGVGPYTFCTWKVAICGLYKHLRFTLVGPKDRRPVVFDDTCYQLGFDDEQAARFFHDLLNSDVASTFFEARVFWDAKRPITAQLLQQLDLLRLADELGRSADWDRFAKCSTLFDMPAK